MANRPIDRFVGRAGNMLQTEYVVIGKQRVSSLFAWSVITFFVGVTVTTAFLASRSGAFEGTYAATTQVFQASADFSSTQGSKNWYYVNGQGNTLTYTTSDSNCGGPCWKGTEALAYITSNAASPGTTNEVVRRWVAPDTGSIRITGNVRDANTSCGDGVSARIRKESTTLWSGTISNGDTTGKNFDVTTTIAKGERVGFELNANGTNVCDKTLYDPKIEFSTGAIVIPPQPIVPPAGTPDIPAVTISGGELCKISDFHRRKVLDEVKQAHERVMNTCKDSDKFNAAERRFNQHLASARYYLDRNRPLQFSQYFLNAVVALKDMRRWSVQASFDTVALDDWRVNAAAIRNTCGAGLPGSNANDNIRLQEAFTCAKSLIPRFVAAEKAYFDLITKNDGKMGFITPPQQSTSLSDWFDATYSDPKSFLGSRSITNFDEYLAAINGLSLTQADDSWRNFLIQNALAAGGVDPSELGGLSGANPGSMYNFPSTAYRIIDYGKQFVNWVIDLGQWGSGIKYDKQNIVDAANTILNRIVPKPSFTLRAMPYDEITQIAQIASSNSESFVEFNQLNKWIRYNTASVLNADGSLSEESFERVTRQISWQFIEKCHIENSSYDVAQCVVYAWNLSCKFAKAAGYSGACGGTQPPPSAPTCTITPATTVVTPGQTFNIAWSATGVVTNASSVWKNDSSYMPVRLPDNSFLSNGNFGASTGFTWQGIHKNAGDKPSQVTITVTGPGGTTSCTSPAISLQQCSAIGSGGTAGDQCHPIISVEQ